MYEAIGYSENSQVPVYPKEVSVHSEYGDCMYMYIGHIVQYVAHSISVNLDEVSVRLWNENGT